MKSTVYPLFAYPVVACAPVYRFTDAERQFIDDLEMIENVGNRMSKNDRILESEELVSLRGYIDEQILHYKKGLLRMKDDNEIYITQSWANRAASREFHQKHRHPNSIISGVMYLGDNSDESLPPIRFHRTLEMFPLEFEYEALNEFNATCRTFEPTDGMLMLFPSLLEHDVEQNRSDRERLSISFNTYVRGTVGGPEQLTEVSIG